MAMSSLIELKKISVVLNQQTILKNISLTLIPKKITTLLGPNGAGKSTLVKIVLGLLTPTSGTVTRQKDLTIGYVPQNISLNPILPITVQRFMQLNRAVSLAEIETTLTLVNAHRLLLKSMHQLSGGEMQRVLLAQALVKKPQLLILDEPTQGVDIDGQIILYDLIAQASSQYQCGVMMVSHDLHLVMAKTDHIICLNKHICCSGAPESVSHDPEFISLFGYQGAQQLAVYKHHHNHQHDFQGRINLTSLNSQSGASHD